MVTYKPNRRRKSGNCHVHEGSSARTPRCLAHEFAVVVVVVCDVFSLPQACAATHTPPAITSRITARSSSSRRVERLASNRVDNSTTSKTKGLSWWGTARRCCQDKASCTLYPTRIGRGVEPKRIFRDVWNLRAALCPSLPDAGSNMLPACDSEPATACHARFIGSRQEHEHAARTMRSGAPRSPGPTISASPPDSSLP